MPNQQLTALQQQLQAELDALTTAQKQIDADATTIAALQSQVASVQAQLDAANAEIAKLTAPPTPTPTPAPTPTPTPTPTPSATPFTIQGGASFADFYSAHAAAKDGDTILVQPGVYNYTLQGWAITKAITVDSAVAGQMVTLAIARRSDGVIGSGISIDCVTRHNNTGSTARWKVTIRNMEVYADGLTFVTGKCAIDVGLRSGTCPLDLTLQNVYLHDYDQGIEADNEYDPADRTSTITVLDSRIEQTGCIASGDNNHSLYVGYCGALTLRNTVVKNVRGANWADPVYVSGSIDSPNYWPVGMLVKSRAKATTIDGCTLIGSANSNAIEYGDGGDLLVTNSHLEAGQWCDGNAILSYGRFYQENNRDATHGEIISEDGRTNRIRVSGCAFVNQFQSGPMQWIEVSNRTTQAGWTAAGQTGSPPPLTIDIAGDNTFTDSPADKAIDITKGWPNLQPSQVFGIPLTIDPIAAPDSAAAAWYAATLPNGWSRLPHPAIYSQVQATAADRANPDDIGGSYKPIYPFTGGDSAGYVTSGNKPWPLAGQAQIAGVDPIPGYLDFRGDQGAIPCYNATVVRRGKTYKGTFLLWFAQGGHGVGLNNQILGYHVDSGVFLDLTQQSIPPMGIADATVNTATQAWRPDDGRWFSTHGYNNGIHDEKRNTILIPAGPAQVVGPGTFSADYAYCLHGDGWAGPNPVSDPSPGNDYFSAGGGARPNGRNGAMCVDNDADEAWNSFPNSGFANDVAVVHTSLAPGSQWRYVELVAGNGPAQIAGAAVAPFCMEKEPWVVWINEVRPYGGATILNRRFNAGSSGAGSNNPAMWEPTKRKFWNVNFVPKGGDPVNAIPSQCDPSVAANVDGGIASTVLYDFEHRVFLAVIFTLQPGVLLGDVYQITPPAIDTSGADGAGSTFVQGIGGSETVVPWTTEKLTQASGSAFELPTRGGAPGSGFYPSHKTAFYVPSPNRGIMFVHDPSKNPLFFRLP